MIKNNKLYLDDTVTTRKVKFTLEGIEKLKRIREYHEVLLGKELPFPTVIDIMIKSFPLPELEEEKSQS